MAGSVLMSSSNHVEVPFIIVQIGDYTFGHCGKSEQNRLQRTFNIAYPNYIESLNVTKINGSINTYVLTMTYAITEHDDPNRLEKVFSSISNSRMITLKYGDWNSPSYIYKNEEAVITKLTTKVNIKSSSIQYVINCTSNALSVTGSTYAFPAKRCKPSDEIKALLTNKRYGLTDVFKGMLNKDLNLFVAGDDQVVQIEAKPSIGLFEYITYLVSCMVHVGDASGELKHSCYFWSVYDDISNKYGGTYFKVVRVAANTNTLVSYNTYEVDVGYPTSSNVLDFVINNDDSWSLLYNYSQEIELPEYSYYIDSKGKLVQQKAPSVATSRTTFLANESSRNWWSLVTQFPITATLTLKGLLRPAMLMSYVKVNTYFFGRKHTSSGLYIITKQEDTINSSGYRTVLTLMRVGGDEHYA